MRRIATFGAAMALLVGAAALAPSTPAQAQSKDEILRSLSTPKASVTRGLGPASPGLTAQQRSLVNSLKGKTTRQITVEERTEIAKVAKDNGLPSVDLEIYFDYDSAAITEVAVPKLVALGQALIDKKLSGSTFLVAGHTDARGSDGYNQGLSEQRAEAVKEYLVSTFKLDPTHLVSIGYGEEQLKHADAPEADENRRVQVINLATN